MADITTRNRGAATVLVLLLHLCHPVSSSGQCHTYRTNDFGSRRVQNTDFQYPWPQLAAGTTRFTVFIQGNKDAYITLSPRNGGISDDNSGDTGIPKIAIGGWQNQESGFLCNSEEDWERFQSPNILSLSEEREFFVQFVNSYLQVGAAGESPFMSVSYSCDVNVKYVGIATGNGGNAMWKYCENDIPTTPPPKMMSTSSTSGATSSSPSTLQLVYTTSPSQVTAKTKTSAGVAVVGGTVAGILIIILILTVLICFLKRRERSDTGANVRKQSEKSGLYNIALENAIKRTGKFNDGYESASLQGKEGDMPEYAVVHKDKEGSMPEYVVNQDNEKEIPEYLEIYQDNHPGGMPEYAVVNQEEDETESDNATLKKKTAEEVPTYEVVNKDEEGDLTADNETEGGWIILYMLLQTMVIRVVVRMKWSISAITRSGM
ncbi:uncharacterized protein [Amphiura filiformis]|uniref:uncharacterized protein n=1 Tax=Amphiura filiformis TaxID=82378 RepID=UPI003B21A99B